MALPQLHLGLPHFIDRFLQDGAGFGIEAGRGRIIMRVAKVRQHILRRAKARRGSPRCAAMVMAMIMAMIVPFIVIVVVIMIMVVPLIVVMAIIVAMLFAMIGGRFRFAFLFAAQKLAVTAAQYPLVAADAGGTGKIAIGGKAALLLEERFSIDDDLSLTAEIGRQGDVDHALQPAAFGLPGRWPAQDQAGAAHFLRSGLPHVAHDELHHHVAARAKPKSAEIQSGAETSIAWRAAARNRYFALAEGHILALADCQRDAEPRGGGDAIIVRGGKDRGPVALTGLYHRQAGGRADRAHLWWTVGNGVDPMERRRRATARCGIDAIEEGGVEQAAGDPVRAVAAQGDGRAPDRQDRRDSCLRIKAQRPFDPRSNRRARVQRCGIARRQPGIGRRDDPQILRGQTRDAGRCGQRFRAGGQRRWPMTGAWPEQREADRDQAHDPREQDQAARPVGTQAVGTVAVDPAEQPRLLEPLKRAK